VLTFDTCLDVSSHELDGIPTVGHIVPATQCLEGEIRRMSQSLERSMTAIWQEVFGLDSVAPTDNFFALGGDSIMASLLAERVTRTIGLQLEFDEVFEHQTIAELCAYVRLRR
jgi:acyl carrier protein